jgi:hypothetical protein
MTHDEIISRLDEFDPECSVRANRKGGGFWTASVKELQAFLADGTIDPESIESLQFFVP